MKFGGFMEVLAKSVYVIDYQTESVEEKPIPEDITDFIDDLFSYIAGNASIKMYKPRSQTTQVVNCARSVIANVIENGGNDPKDLNNLMFEEIAKRLLLSEKEVQKRIWQLGTNVKKGSLVQAAVCLDDGQEYSYFIAKVNHTDFIEDNNFTIKSGFTKQENIWKSCQFNINLEYADLTIDFANIYLDNSAKYWADNFLELDEVSSDEKNTEKAFKHIEKILSNNVKKTAFSDYVILRNAVVSKLKTPQLINYNEMIESIFSDYSPEVMSTEDLVKVKGKLLDPEKIKFDSQFHTAPNAIKAKIKKSYRVNNGIEINITGAVDEIRNTIRSVEEEGGTRYIKIRTNDEETYNAFKRNS